MVDAGHPKLLACDPLITCSVCMPYPVLLYSRFALHTCDLVSLQSDEQGQLLVGSNATLSLLLLHNIFDSHAQHLISEGAACMIEEGDGDLT